MIITFFIILLVVLPYCLLGQIDCDKTTLIEPQINLQYAGNVGLGSIGVGCNLKRQKIYFGGIYGYLPSSMNGAEVHTIAIKASYNFFSRQISKNSSIFNYIGTNINYVVARNTYLTYPKYYPKNYYATNALFFAPFLGFKMEHILRYPLHKIKKIGIYCELGTTDKYIDNCISFKHIRVIDIFNLCTGISFNFGEIHL